MNTTPETTLNDVRHAYRLLHDYQRLVLDSIGFVGTQLGFRYSCGWQHFSNTPPRNGSGSLGHWAWDWLGLYYYQFHFTRDDQWLSAFHIPDDGAVQVERKERTNTRNFPSADQSKSIMIFIYAARSEDWNIDHFNADPKLLLKTAETGESSGSGVQLRSIGMERLFTESSARQVVEELRTHFCLSSEKSVL